MAADETTTDETGADQSDEGGKADDAPLSLADRLSWDAETQGEMPEGSDVVSLGDLSEFLTERDAETEQKTTERLTAQREAQHQAELNRQRTQGEAQTDIDFFNGIRAKLESSDNTERNEAIEATKGEQYLRGAAALKQQGEAGTMAAAYASMVQIAHRELSASGEDKFMPDPTSQAWPVFAADTLQKFDGKGGFFAYAIDYGRQQGLAEGIAQGRSEAERDGRIDKGAEGATNLPPTRTASGALDLANMSPDQINANWEAVSTQLESSR